MKKQVEIILNNKIIFMGLAMLLVLLYHQPADGVVKSIYFYPGFLGVDIFLFFSGFGLCYSFNKNSLGEFYKHRFTRILPLYMLLGLFVSLMHFKDSSLWDFFCNMTSLFYYGLGGIHYEWYLSSLFVFYLIFPILYLGLVKIKPFAANWVGGVILSIWIATLTLFALTDTPWWYETAIGRVPIFILGILCYLSAANFKRGMIIFMAMLIPTMVLYSYGVIQTFVLVYCCGPAIMLILSFIVPLIKKHGWLNYFFTITGSKSLEIYVANCIVVIAMGDGFSGAAASGIYWAGHLLVVPLLCWINSTVYKALILKTT